MLNVELIVLIVLVELIELNVLLLKISMYAVKDTDDFFKIFPDNFSQTKYLKEKENVRRKRYFPISRH